MGVALHAYLRKMKTNRSILHSPKAAIGNRLVVGCRMLIGAEPGFIARRLMIGCDSNMQFGQFAQDGCARESLGGRKCEKYDASQPHRIVVRLWWWPTT